MTHNSGNREEVDRAFFVLNAALIPFVEGEMLRVHGEHWRELLKAQPHHRDNWDTQRLLAIIWDQWSSVFRTRLGRAERSLIVQLQEARNDVAHQESFSCAEAHRAVETMELLLRAISAPEAQQLAAQKERLLIALLATRQKPTIPQPAPPSPPPRYQAPPLAPGSPDSLNDQQQAAVEHTGSHLLILAGAGTGKTKTITHRTATLLRTVPAENILVMSFTIKAAQELYERLCRITHSSKMSQLWIGTFHSICRRMLSENATLLGYKSRFGVLDTDDSRDVLRRCVPQDKFLDATRVSQVYSLWRNAMVPWRTLLEKFGLTPREQLVGETLRRYHQRMRRANKMDFDDLLVNAISLLEQHQNVRERYQRRFRHILVDEYQDTSRAQSRILELLAYDANVTVVGDDSQAIYGFRGATVENILTFDTAFPKATTLRLERNYRSTPEILSVANESIARNIKRKPKSLFTTSPTGRKPVVVEAADRVAEANFVADEILALNRAGMKLRDIAVLFRSALCVRTIEGALQVRGIPYSLFGAVPFFSQPHIKDLLAWFALVSDPEDEYSFGRVWRQQRDLTDALLGNVEAEADKGGKPLWQTAFDVVNPRARDALQDLQLKVSLCRDEYQKTKNLVVLLDNTVNLHFGDYIRRTFTDANARLEDLRIVREMLARYSSLDTFLEEVGTERLDLSQHISTAGFEDGDFVSAASVHAAKGLEWRVVFLVGLVDGWLPDRRCLDEIGIEEERRLFHVAVTRAKQTLYLSYPQNVPDRAGDCHVPLSRFVKELPNSLFESSPVPSKAAAGNTTAKNLVAS